MEQQSPGASYSCVAPQVTLPLELNSRIRCEWKDGDFYRCKILERRLKPDYDGRSTDPYHTWEYYVHFSGCEHKPAGISNSTCSISDVVAGSTVQGMQHQQLGWEGLVL